MTNRLVLVHGFTQTSRCWSPFDGLLDARFEQCALDAPGHGDAAGLAVDMRGTASYLAQRGGDAIYLGYSMGGRMSLRVALDHPARVRGLVLISASPGIADDSARRERVAHDDALAARIEQIGVAAFIDEWLAQPMFAHLPAASAHRAERLRNNPAGLAASLRLAGTGAQESLWDRLDELSMPVLLIAGSFDAKYVTIARQMSDAIGPNATVVEVAGVGHTAHLESPSDTARVVNDWLATFGATTGTH
jgi:2-succinyl-6-hydroxy-2,4-cyclohexadiene-1-carboxylate synthase